MWWVRPKREWEGAFVLPKVSSPGGTQRLDKEREKKGRVWKPAMANTRRKGLQFRLGIRWSEQLQGKMVPVLHPFQKLHLWHGTFH